MLLAQTQLVCFLPELFVNGVFTQTVEGLDRPPILISFTSPIISRTKTAELHTSRDGEGHQGLSLVLGRVVGRMRGSQEPLYGEEFGFCFVGEEVEACEVFSKECRTTPI